MKKMKKLLSMLLTVIMVLAMAAPSFADEVAVTGPFNVTIKNAATNHSYKVYQIFKGDLSQDGTELTLSNIVWGNGVDGATLLSKLKENNKFSACESAADVAEVLQGFSDNDEDIRNFAKVVEDYLSTEAGTIDANHDKVSVNDAGYYMIKDVAGSGNTTTVSSLVLKVVNTVEVTLKIADNPTPEKSIDGNKTDYAVGENIPFTLKATLPTDGFDDYDTYKLEFVDTLSEGLTYVYQDGNVATGITSLTIGEGAGSQRIESQYFGSYGISVSYDNNILKVTINNVKSTGDTGVKAQAGDVIVVKYNAKLNDKAIVFGEGGNDAKNTNKLELKFSNDPNSDGTGTTVPTPDVEVKTYKITVNKVDGSTYPSTGTDEAKLAAATKLSGAEFKLYRYKVNSGQVTDTKEYAKIDATSKVVTWTETEADGTTYRTESDGAISFKGLATGTYYVKETKAPVGFNLAEDAQVTITADVNGNTVVKDFAGATLPSTGGIGTTIFYAVGIILMAGAVFFVVRKKRA